MSDGDTKSVNGVNSAAAFDTMVIRAWMEAGHEDRFRARLTFTSDSGNAGSTVVASAAEDVLDAVRDWLADVQSTGGNADASPGSDEPER
jgi:hypothetical protein